MKSYKVNNPNSLMDELLKNSPVQIKNFKPGDLVDGLVVSVSPDQILVDIGAKSEGVVLKDEFTEGSELEKTLSAGDKVSLVVLQSEDKQGYALLSLKRAEKEKIWRDLDNAHKSNSVLEATIIEYNKGGLLAEVGGTRGFIPLSHLSSSHFTEEMADLNAGSEEEKKTALKVLAGKKLNVKVIEVDKSKNRLVLSEKDATSEYSEEERNKKLENIKVGDKLTGLVTGVMISKATKTPSGLFVDVDGLEGLVHISEIAWEKVTNPTDYYPVGSKIEVLVLSIGESDKKLSLSVKRLTSNPWEGVDDRYKAGQKVSGKVSKVASYGAFVTLESGLEGLIHVSEMKDKVSVGDEIEAIVTNVDGANQKLALSTKQLSEEEK